MAVPKKHQSKSATGQRRSHLAIKKMRLSACKKCNAPVRPHHACAVCGEYKGKKV
ncbi:MAG: 50S ribosomal protein L32 [bacterium]|nr:50S ribosomal protein L32 [bacterium]